MTCAEPLEELEHSLDRVLRVMTERTVVDDVARRSGYELPPASWALLEYLKTGGALRVSDIAKCHGVDVSSVTPRLKRLEDAGLVTRERAPSDGRAFLIRITARGTHALERVHAARREMLESALAGLRDSRVCEAAAVLQLVADHLESESPPTEG